MYPNLRQLFHENQSFPQRSPFFFISPQPPHLCPLVPSWSFWNVPERLPFGRTNNPYTPQEYDMFEFGLISFFGAMRICATKIFGFCMRTRKHLALDHTWREIP